MWIFSKGPFACFRDPRVGKCCKACCQLCLEGAGINNGKGSRGANLLKEGIGGEGGREGKKRKN